MTQTIIKGAGGGKSGGGGGHESDDTLFSTAYIEVIEAVCEGPIKGLVNGGKSIYLNDTPILAEDGAKNYSVAWDIRLGEQSQLPFPAVQSVSDEQQISIKVEKAVPHVVSITDADADYAVVTVGFPRLLKIDGNGNIDGASVEFAIDLQPSGGSYAPVSRPVKIDTVAYNAAGHYWQSPPKTFYAEVYCSAPTPGSATIQHSTDGATWTTAQILPLVAEKTRWGQTRYVGHAGLTLDEGVHYLRWGDDTETGFVYYNFPRWHSYGSAGNITITGKTGSKYQRQFRFPLTGNAPWNVRLTRVTDDSASQKLANDLYWDSLRTEITAQLSYPNTALIYYKIPAKEFSSVPTRRAELDLQLVRIPSNYNPTTRVYTGIWDGSFTTAWTDNPAWCFYDICTQKRYGVGKFIDAASIDKWALYQIGQYCDELVDSGRRDNLGAVIYEPRFTLNIHITEAREAFDWLRDLSSVFRGMMYVINGLLTTVADQPKDPTRLFTTANVIDGQFRFSGTGGLARKTVAWVKWRDPTDLYNEKYEYVPSKSGIKRYGINLVEASAIGCTSRGQAHRFGKYLLLDGEAMNFSTGHDSAYVQPGDIIQCAIPLRSKAKRLGGRLLAVDGATVTLDAQVTLTLGHNYQLSALLADGTIGSRTVIVTETLTTATLTLASALPETVPNAIWVLIDTNGIQPTQWRVIGIEDAVGFTKKITCISHDPNKYAALDTIDNDITASLLPSQLDRNLSSPGGITIENLPFRDKNGVAQNKLIVSWLQVPGATRYQLRWRLGDGQWRSSPTIQGTWWESIIKDDGLYQFEIVAISAIGKLSAPGSASTNINGSSSPINQSVDIRVTGTTPRLLAVLPLEAGSYRAPRAVLGCPDITHAATVQFKAPDGTVLATVGGVAGGIKKRIASAGFELTASTDVNVVAFADAAGVKAIIKSYSL